MQRQVNIQQVVTDSVSNMVEAFNLPGFEEINDDGQEENEASDMEEGAPPGISQFQTDHIANNVDMMVNHYFKVKSPFTVPNSHAQARNEGFL